MEEKFKTKNDTEKYRKQPVQIHRSYISTLMALNIKFGKSFMFMGDGFLHTHLVA